MILYEKKRILLIEDCNKHANETEKLLDEMKDKYSIECKVFPYLTQNGNTREQQGVKIKEYILNEIDKKSFDILMIDMLLGGDSAEDPLGLEVVKDSFKELKDKKIKIFIYTELSSDCLDVIKKYNKTIGNCLNIIMKPDMRGLDNRVDCTGEKRKAIINKNDDKCIKNLCTYKEKFLCDMKNAFFELRDNNE